MHGLHEDPPKTFQEWLIRLLWRRRRYLRFVLPLVVVVAGIPHLDHVVNAVSLISKLAFSQISELVFWTTHLPPPEPLILGPCGESLAQRASAQETCDCAGAFLAGRNLSKSNLSDCNLRSTRLTNANLEGADLSRARLEHADLTGANLRKAIVFGAYMERADLTDAKLMDADLRCANLLGATLHNADLTGARLDGVKNLPTLHPIRADAAAPDDRTPVCPER